MNQTMLCDLEGASYLFFNSSIPPLVYYSHIPIIIISLVLAFFVLTKGWNRLQNRALFLTIIPFVCWTILDSIFWASNRSDVIMAVWAIIVLIEPLVYLGCFYLLYVYIEGKNPPILHQIAWLLFYTPLIFFTPTDLLLSGFNISTCLAIETPLAYYSYVLEGLLLLGIGVYAVRAYRAHTDHETRERLIYLTAGIVLLLLAFSWGNITGSFTDNWELGQYGLFGMPVFLGIISYLIVRYKAFQIRLIGSHVLVVAVWFMLFGLLFVDNMPRSAQIVLAINLILFSALGIQLIRSVRHEVQQRMEIEQLAANLSAANNRLKELDKMKSEFVSIASHQLRSPLTAIRGYASMLLEGSFGKLTKKAAEAISRIQESSRYMALSVEDYLNVSRIEAGNMKYELSNFDLKDEVEKVANEVRPTVEHKGLTLEYKSQCAGACMVHADIGKTRQVIQNVIDNAMKYTPGGKIMVTTEDDGAQRISRITIKDTGIGMSKETIETLFDKFIRAQNANKVNVTGTGLGLFVAKKMVEGMGGKIWAESEGEGKGSSFIIEFPLAD